MEPLPQRTGGLPFTRESQIGRGLGPSLKTIVDAASCGVAPTNAADLYSCVVPVLPIIGRVQLNCRAEPADVPLPVSSLDRPWTIEFASGSTTACSHGSSYLVMSSFLPLRSLTSKSGVGG